MSNKKKIGIKTLYGAIILNMIISTYHLTPKLFTYFYSYLSYINENIYNRDIVELYISLSHIIYLLSIPFGIILNFKYGFNTNTLTGISLLLNILSIYFLINCSTNNLFIIYLIIKSSSNGLCLLPIIYELWNYYPNKKGLMTGVFFLGKGFTYLTYESLSIRIINPHNIDMIKQERIYPPEVNENYFIYLKIYISVLCILSSICLCLIYPYSIYANYNSYKMSKFREKLNRGELKDFYILSSPRRNTIDSTKNTSTEYWLDNSDKEIGRKKEIKEIKEPFISLITSYPYIQLTSVYFLVNVFNSIDLPSINKIGLNNNFGRKYLRYTSAIWNCTIIITNVILGILLDKMKFKKFLIYLLLILIFSISIFYFITNDKYGFIIFNIFSSVINSINNVIVPISFSKIFGEKNGLLLFGISSIVINTFCIYSTFINQILIEKIYYFVLCLICTVFYMIALITLCLFEEKKHIYIYEEENKDENIFNDLSEGQELDDICDIKEFENMNNENK
jgi:hypothetical protein